MLSELSLKLLTLAKLKGIGPATIKKLIANPAFTHATVQELAGCDSKLAKAILYNSALGDATNAAFSDVESAEKINARIITLVDDHFPKLLKATPDCPAIIYVLGQLAPVAEKSVAIIGTRSPTEHGKLITERVTEFFVTQGWSVVSGLALGCDTLAHEVAVDNGGHTVAVLAHGLHTVAPKQNRNLANKIVESGGALVTEYGFGVDPIPPLFVKRDRIQAGFSKGVVMIQSDLDGGSLHASRAAIEYQRVLAVPKPTVRDALKLEKKIEANNILLGDNVGEKLDLLKCDIKALERIFAINSKDDYLPLVYQLQHI